MPSEVTAVGGNQSVEELRRELAEAREQQAATAEILASISSSVTDANQVFAKIATSAAHLCDAYDAAIGQRKGDELHLVAHYGPIPTTPVVPLIAGALPGRAALDRQTIHVADLQVETDEYPEGSERARRLGFHTILAVPLMRAGEAIGTITIRRSEIRPFTDRQIDLLKTFADQAVIAIENTRLFEHLQKRTLELQESLEHQMATSEVLSVISRSTFDLKPVLEVVCESATRLCGASRGHIFRFDGEYLRVAAGYGAKPEFMTYLYPIKPGTGSVARRAALERRTIQAPDVLLEPGYERRDLVKQQGYRTVLAVPMLREGALLGVITILRTKVEPFTGRQVALVETFADQAVIAIENARLFEEVQKRSRELARSVQELKSLGAVAQAVTSSLELKVVLARILEHACAMSGAGGGAFYVLDKARGQFDLEAGHNMSDELIKAVREHPLRLGESVVGQCVEQRQPVQIDDLNQAPSHALYDIHLQAGVQALLAVPLLHQDEVIGALAVRRKQAGIFTEETVGLLQSFADHSAIAIENARLFEEIARKSSELEIASRHKSQFVANMSHELRTPLTAILGYAELMQEGFYEPQGPKSLGALARIRSNSKHLLGLINTVLDIAKIESGQFSLNLSEYALANVVETVRAATEALAETKKLGFTTDVAKRLPIGVGDEQRLTQVLLNLVGNAIKFTDKGEVRISAVAVNSHFAVRVTDTGPGIPIEEQKLVFEQFHQVDSSNTKAKGGTGLGLAIAKQIVEMHGGRIWVESTLGKGATFQIELPILAEKRKATA